MAKRFTACYETPDGKPVNDGGSSYDYCTYTAGSPEEVLRTARAKCPKGMILKMVNWQGPGTAVIWHQKGGWVRKWRKMAFPLS